MSNLTAVLTTLITSFYVQTSLFGLIVAMAIESCCIPLPSEVVIPIAGVLFFQGKILPGTNPVLGIILLGLAGAIGCLLGSIVAYWIGYKGGRPLMLKYGRYVLISQHDADMADRFFQKYGAITAFVARLLPGIRTFISLPAGIAEMPFGKFCIYSFLGSFPWCVLLAYAGYVLGNNMTVIDPYYKSFEYVIIAVVVLLVILYIWRHVSNDRKARAEHAETIATQPQQNDWQQQYQQPQQQNQYQQPQRHDWQQSGQPTPPQPPRYNK